MSRVIKTLTPDNSGEQAPESGRLSLGIRSSLLLGFGVVLVVMVLSVVASIVFSLRSNTVVEDIVESKLPATVHTFRVVLAADALATYGLSMATLSTEENRDMVFNNINNSIESLKGALNDLKSVVSDKSVIPCNLFTELQANLKQLQVIVEDRIKLRTRQSDARTNLLSNLLVLQRHLVYRIRILEGDGDVIQRLMKRTPTPKEKVAVMAQQLTKLLPAARFYATVESIHGRLLGASQSPSLTKLSISRQELTAALANLRENFALLPEDLRQDLWRAMDELDMLILSKDGLIQLRERELLLLEKIKEFNKVNQGILHRVNTATAKMVNTSQNEMVEAGATLTISGQRSMFILICLSGLGLLCVAGVMHFYVNRKVIAGLSWVSAAMQDLAAGRLDISLPPTGPTELGRLGAALQHFRDITAEARAREDALHASNKRAQQAMDALKEKTAELERIAVTDSLTGLANRMRLDIRLQSEINRSKRYRNPFTLILLDIDHFKKVNDQLGHQTGDKVLQNVAKTIQDNVREADLPGRWGGEEFMIICPETNLEGGITIANKIKNCLKKLDMTNTTTLTASFGVAEFGLDEDENDLVRRADTALYKAKANGRDRVETA